MTGTADTSESRTEVRQSTARNNEREKNFIRLMKNVNCEWKPRKIGANLHSVTGTPKGRF